jgi:hypothetical protein
MNQVESTHLEGGAKKGCTTRNPKTRDERRKKEGQRLEEKMKRKGFQ